MLVLSLESKSHIYTVWNIRNQILQNIIIGKFTSIEAFTALVAVLCLFRRSALTDFELLLPVWAFFWWRALDICWMFAVAFAAALRNFCASGSRSMAASRVWSQREESIAEALPRRTTFNPNLSKFSARLSAPTLLKADAKTFVGRNVSTFVDKTKCYQY